MRAHDPDALLAVRRRHHERAAPAERRLVLADLVALRQVGVEVVLAREDRVLGDLAAEREAELDRELDRARVRHRQRARMREADGARVRVLGGAVLELAAAEHLRARLQVRVDLEADDGLPLSHRASRSFAARTAASMSSFTSTISIHVLERGRQPAHEPQLALARLERELHVADEHRARAVEHARLHAEDTLDRGHELGRRILEAHRHPASLAGTGSKPSARSSAWPTRKSVFSENCGPISCSPTGSPSDSPHGTFRPGSPARHDGIVSRSLRYIASGLSVRAPSLNATVGDVGETSTSKRSNDLGVLAREQRPHLLRLPVVRVVVAGRERVRADHDPALRLVAEALVARALVHLEPVARRGER